MRLALLSAVLFALMHPLCAAGQNPVCYDFRGLPVVWVSDPTLNDVGHSDIVRGVPVIYINPDALRFSSPKTRLFWLAHECGHHALGHLARRNMTAELEADCYGIRLIRAQGLASDDDLPIIEAEVGSMSPGDWTHLGGMQRTLHLKNCIDAGTQPRLLLKDSDVETPKPADLAALLRGLENDSDAQSCLEADYTIHWDRGRRVARVDSKFDNACRRPIYCVAAVMTGTVPTHEREPFTPYVAARKTLRLSPGEKKSFSDELAYASTGDRTLAQTVRVGDNLHDPSWSKCQFSDDLGKGNSAIRGNDDFSTAVLRMADAAKDSFKAVRDPQIASHNFESTIRIPYENTFYSCTFESTSTAPTCTYYLDASPDETKIRTEFAKLVKKIEDLFPSWNRREQLLANVRSPSHNDHSWWTWETGRENDAASVSLTTSYNKDLAKWSLQLAFTAATVQNTKTADNSQPPVANSPSGVFDFGLSADLLQQLMQEARTEFVSITGESDGGGNGASHKCLLNSPLPSSADCHILTTPGSNLIKLLGITTTVPPDQDLQNLYELVLYRVWSITGSGWTREEGWRDSNNSNWKRTEFSKGPADPTVVIVEDPDRRHVSITISSRRDF